MSGLKMSSTGCETRYNNGSPIFKTLRTGIMINLAAVKQKSFLHTLKLAFYIAALAVNMSASIARAEDGKRYEVELLVFRNFAPELDGNELWDWEGANSAVEHLAEAIGTSNRPP